MTPFVLVLLLLSLTAIPQGAAQDNDDDDDNNDETVVENSEEDNSTDVSEAINTVNGNITGLSDGDVAKPRGRNARRCPFNLCKWRKRGSYVRVPYVIHRAYNARERSIIINALNLINKYTCIRFFRRYWFHFFYLDYIYFLPGTGCWSYVGRVGGRQPISLQRGRCVFPGMVHHSLLHTLGFHHEHSRSDRDTYVNILRGNILPGAERNFVKFYTNNLGTGYNYRSIMHYGKYAFSRNGWPTIVSKRNPNEPLGNSFITWGDIFRVNRFYGCCE